MSAGRYRRVNTTNWRNVRASLQGFDDVCGRLYDCAIDISNWWASLRVQLNEDNTESSRHLAGAQPCSTRQHGADGGRCQSVPVLSNCQQWSEISAFYSIKSSARRIKTSREWRHPPSTSCGDSVRYVVQSARNSSLRYSSLDRFGEARLMTTKVLAGLPSCRFNASRTLQRGWFSTRRMCDHGTTVWRKLHWSPAHMRVNYELWTMHCDALNSYRTVSNVLHRYDSFRRRQLDEVWIVFHRHRSVSATEMSHGNYAIGERGFFIDLDCLRGVQCGSVKKKLGGR